MQNLVTNCQYTDDYGKCWELTAEKLKPGKFVAYKSISKGKFRVRRIVQESKYDIRFRITDGRPKICLLPPSPEDAAEEIIYEVFKPESRVLKFATKNTLTERQVSNVLSQCGPRYSALVDTLQTDVAILFLQGEVLIDSMVDTLAHYLENRLYEVLWNEPTG